MIINLFAVGDIVGLATVEILKKKLWKIREELGADAVIANGENAYDVKGIGAAEAKTLLESGVDLITTGNHVWGRWDLFPMLDRDTRILRPANFPATTPGSGHSILGSQLLKVSGGFG